MPLADYTPERVTVSFPGGDFSVRALGVGDLTVVFRAFVDDMAAISQVLETRIGGRVITQAAGIAIAMDLIRLAPGSMSLLIALASDEPAAAEQAARLPLHAQVAALSAIARLTFQDVDGLGNTLAALFQAAGAIVPSGAPPT